MNFLTRWPLPLPRTSAWTLPGYGSTHDKVFFSFCISSQSAKHFIGQDTAEMLFSGQIVHLLCRRWHDLIVLGTMTIFCWQPQKGIWGSTLKSDFNEMNKWVSAKVHACAHYVSKFLPNKQFMLMPSSKAGYTLWSSAKFWPDMSLFMSQKCGLTVLLRETVQNKLCEHHLKKCSIKLSKTVTFTTILMWFSQHNER